MAHPDHTQPANVRQVDPPESLATVRLEIQQPRPAAIVHQEERTHPTILPPAIVRQNEQSPTAPSILAPVRHEEITPRPTWDPTHPLSVQVESRPPPSKAATTRSSYSRGGSSPGRASPGRHPTFRGIRTRSGKWVSEIREPRKTNRIWLGTYPTPEMAAAAFDVAALALKGGDVILNFPDRVSSYPSPASPSPADIRRAAAAAALLMKPDAGESSVSGQPGSSGGDVSTADVGMVSEEQQEYVDEEALFDMPNILVDMAGGMLMSPPRMSPAPPDDDSSEDTGGGDLWSYH